MIGEVSKEIEQRYIIDPRRGLYLPPEYKEFHQAEIGSGSAQSVIEKFFQQTDGILTGANDRHGSDIQALFSRINRNQQVKIRVRRIFDPREHSLRAEFTLKEKIESNTFKVYREHNLPINAILGLTLIEHIAPRLNIGGMIEYGVRKFRYIVGGPDGFLWDIDMLQGLNTGIHLGEIEVPSVDTKFSIPEFAVRKVNGERDFHFLGTSSLQKKPWAFLEAKTKARYNVCLS